MAVNSRHHDKALPATRTTAVVHQRYHDKHSDGCSTKVKAYALVSHPIIAPSDLMLSWQAPQSRPYALAPSSCSVMAARKAP